MFTNPEPEALKEQLLNSSIVKNDFEEEEAERRDRLLDEALEQAQQHEQHQQNVREVLR